MQIFTIILAIGLFIHDSMGISYEQVSIHWPMVIGIWLVPKLFLLIIFQLFCLKAIKHPSQKRIKNLSRMGSLFRHLLLGSYALDLSFSVLGWVRHAVGDWVLVDEVIFLIPVLICQLYLWQMYYPLDRKLREAMAFNSIDTGEPVAPIWTLRQYMMSHIRHTLLFPGVPVLILLAWTETLYFVPREWITLADGQLIDQHLTMAGALIVFLLMPVFIRRLWDTKPMPDSPLRSRLMAMCKQYKVGIGEILYWRTYGGMANGAVIGLFGKLRVILLSDVLLSQMSPLSIQGVMAHEIAHVQKKHMFWMFGAAGAMMVLYQTVFAIFFWFIGDLFLSQVPSPDYWQTSFEYTFMVLGFITAGICWLFSFGWISRRMERQADSFAVAHFAKINDHPRIEPEDVTAFTDALEDLVTLNHVSKTKNSWRHGSIAWRQDNLKKLTGSKPTQMPIDATMRKINFMILLAIFLASWLLYGGMDVLENFFVPQKANPVILVKQVNLTRLAHM